MDIKKLLVRSISGLVYVGLIIGSIFWGQLPFTCLAALFALLATIEFAKINGRLNSNYFLPILAECLGNIILCFSWMIWPLYFWVVMIIFRFVIEIYLKNDNPIRDLAISMMSQIYVGVPLALMCLIGEWVNLHAVLVIFFMIWINDTGAFITGSLLGRHKLFERVSPKKSWEGFFGGLVFNLIAATLFCEFGAHFFGISDSLFIWLCLGALVTLFATWGDLLESLMKRSLHIKDSGNIMPGHGGILDRIDSLLLVMPAAWLYLTFLFVI